MDYVFKHDLAHLYAYHLLVLDEMHKRFRNVNIDVNWYGRTYRGKSLPKSSLLDVGIYVHHCDELIYPEHDDKYLKECLLNLHSKNAELINGKNIEEMLIALDLKCV